MKYKIKKQYRFYGFVFIGLALFLYLAFQYFDFLKLQKEQLENESYLQTSIDMQNTLAQMILVKKKSTTAIAFSIANNQEFIKQVADKKADVFDYRVLIQNFREHTLYKNIWIQILDEEANVLYRSWTKEKGENLVKIRKDLQEVMKKQTVVSSINPGRHDLSIRAIVPLILENKFIGMLEVISHFNSISKSLAQTDIESVVVLKKEFRTQLKHPMTKLFIGDYYVANKDAPQHFRDYLESNGLENYLNNSYKVEDGKIIVSYEMMDLSGAPVGYYIMSKDISDISQIDLDFYMFKWTASTVIILMGMMIVWSGFLYFAKARDKNYYLNVINTSNNIIIISDKVKMIEVNQTFFKYFQEFESIEQVQKRKVCLCDYFIQENGYIDARHAGMHWIDYLIEHQDQENKAKVNLYGEIKYFSISASLVSDDPEHYAVIMSEITQQENYKRELEYLSTTDSLTRMGNRRYFQMKIQEEIARSKRYKTPLSMILFDIDFFKQVNDQFGHDIGDQVLVEYSEIIHDMLRENDVFCRIGGEEFVIVSPHTTLEEARVVAEKVRLVVKEAKKIVPITMSFGVVEYHRGESVDAMFKRADTALYKAKDMGRDKVVFD